MAVVEAVKLRTKQRVLVDEEEIDGEKYAEFDLDLLSDAERAKYAGEEIEEIDEPDMDEEPEEDEDEELDEEPDYSDLDEVIAVPVAEGQLEAVLDELDLDAEDYEELIEADSRVSAREIYQERLDALEASAEEDEEIDEE